MGLAVLAAIGIPAVLIFLGIKRTRGGSPSRWRGAGSTSPSVSRRSWVGFHPSSHRPSGPVNDEPERIWSHPRSVRV